MNILVLNCGSSSIKYKLFDMPDGGELAGGLLERIGEETSLLSHRAGGRKVRVEGKVADHREGLKWVVEALLHPEHGTIGGPSEIDAVGHRVVHGGERFTGSVLITPEVLDAVREFISLAPLHNPPNLMGIEAARELLPDVPQVAVFDTAFHGTMPRYAYLYAIPYEYYENYHIRRYGFHGTSHRYVTLRAAQILGRPSEELKLITCHLGNGCSMAAVKGGRSVDTSMGFTPLEGLVMGTRSGDVDPAVIPFLARAEGMSADEVEEVLNKRSGLLGLSGVSNDMREVERASEAGDERAKVALEVFAYRVKKYIGAYVAVLGGLDALVFTAGIGENSYKMREMICEGLEVFGIALDHERNRRTVGRKEGDISREGSPVRVLVVPTDEELLIAKDTFEIVRQEG
ncbi:MAG: acetate kinase [Candidatus Latescibacterota bacterium]|nr:MAG: acetate kinase [Candidatus Latescibacterota bacterium]